MPRFKNFRRCIWKTKEECQRFRSLLINGIVATDIFDPQLKAFRNSRWERAFHPKDQEAAIEDTTRSKAAIVIEYIIQASDVAHTMQHWHIYSKWNERLFKEMYFAYLSGRAEKDPSEGWYGGELWFFDFYVIPLSLKLRECGVFGVSSDEYHAYATQNRVEWERKGKEIVERMKTKYTKEARKLGLLGEAEEYVHYDLIAPAGKLGVVFEENEGSLFVQEVDPTSPMSDCLEPGDSIVQIDGVDTASMSAEAITAFLHVNADHERKLVVRRPVIAEE